MRKRGQFALEYLLTHAWSIFTVIVILGFLGFYFFNYSSYANKIAGSINSIKSSSISGLALLSQDKLEIPSQVEQDSYLEVTINPGSKGIYKFAYIYDSEDKLIEKFNFNCEDICKDKKTASILANFSLGSYYVAVFSYDEDKYIRKDFEVVSELQEECILKRAYWEKENASKNEQVSLYLESENCEGKKAVFSIYREGLFSNELVENISAVINSEKTIVSWNAKWENSALILWLYKKNPVYYFRVSVNPEITSENELSVSDKVLSEEETHINNNNYVHGEVIIKLKDDEKPMIIINSDTYSIKKSRYEDKISKLKAKYRLMDEKPVFEELHAQIQNKNLILNEPSLKEGNISKQQSKIKHAEKLLPIYRFKTDRDVETVLNELSQDPNIEYAEPNYIARLALVPNDSDYSVQWPLNNRGQNYPASTGSSYGKLDSDIDAQEAWDIHTGSPEIIIAVLDTGVDYAHPDLAANMWINEYENPGNGIDDDMNGYTDDVYGYDFDSLDQKYRDPDPMDTNGHGTHVAGIVAAKGNNNLDITGVSWNSKIMALKFIGSTTGTLADASDAFYYAVNNGAKIISNSWTIEGYSNVMRDAVDYAYSNGVIVVAAAGNAHRDKPEVPALYEKVIAVAATDSNDQKASFSNFGSWIDLAAPGVDVLSLKLGGGTTIKSGTSMASPHVAGVVALLLSYNPKLSNEEVIDILKDSADDLGFPGKDYFFGYGRINAYKALIKSTVFISSPSPNEFLRGKVNVTGSAYSPLNFHNYEVYYAPKGQPENTVTICSSTESVENSSLCLWDTTSAPEGETILTLKATLIGGEEIIDAVDLSVDNINNPPEFKYLYNRGAVVDKLLEFKVEAEDLDNPEFPEGQLLYSVDNLPPRAQFNNQVFSWQPSQLDEDSYNVAFIVRDNKHTVYHNITITIVNIQTIQIVNDSSLQNFPDIYKDKVVWNDKRTGADTIYLYNVSTGEETLLTSGRDADVYGNKIVYTKDTNRNDIYMYDLSTREETQITSDANTQQSPVIYDNKITWEDQRNGNSDIYMYDLSTRKETQISNDSEEQRFPEIDQNRIVWLKFFKEGISSILKGVYMYDISTGEETLISGAPLGWKIQVYADIINPSIYGDKIVWNDKRSGNNNIYMYDLAALKETQITAYPGEEYHPVIHEGRVAYIRDNDLYVYDISTDSEIRITYDAQYKSDADIYGNRIVWTDAKGVNMAVLTTRTCSDGTRYGECSINKPKYCLNGILIENCSVCSCSSGNCLANGSCESVFISEDVVQDKNIDIKDLIKIGVNFGRTDCSSGNNYCERADVNRDGRIDVQDLIRVGLKFGYAY